jgi:hypothetical protein
LVPVQDGAGPEEDVQGRRGVNVMKRFFYLSANSAATK